MTPTLQQRAEQLLNSPALEGLGPVDRAVVLAMAAGGAAVQGGVKWEDLDAARKMFALRCRRAG